MKEFISLPPRHVLEGRGPGQCQCLPSTPEGPAEAVLDDLVQDLLTLLQLQALPPGAALGLKHLTKRKKNLIYHRSQSRAGVHRAGKVYLCFRKKPEVNHFLGAEISKSSDAQVRQHSQPRGRRRPSTSSASSLVDGDQSGRRQAAVGVLTAEVLEVAREGHCQQDTSPLDSRWTWDYGNTMDGYK